VQAAPREKMSEYKISLKTHRPFFKFDSIKEILEA
jgi:hypothetical protein